MHTNSVGYDNTAKPLSVVKAGGGNFIAEFQNTYGCHAIWYSCERCLQVLPISASKTNKWTHY